MKVESVAVCRFNGDTAEPVLLDIAHNLADFGFFQKGPAKEFLNFATRTLAKRLPGAFACACARARAAPHRCAVPPPPRAILASPRLAAGMHCVEYQGKLCFAVVLAEGLSAIAVCDKEYPSRVALSMLKDLANEVKTGEHASRWRSATVEGSCKIARLEALLRDYQDPTKVDKIAKVDKSLTETKEVLTKTIDAVLARGEKLDDLVDRSAELSASSKMFYKTGAWQGKGAEVAVSPVSSPYPALAWPPTPLVRPTTCLPSARSQEHQFVLHDRVKDEGA